MLRENFCASNLEFLEYDVPIMALTATATDHVREDILESLNLSKETKTVLTSFFRPNLQFLVSFKRFLNFTYIYGTLYASVQPYHDIGIIICKFLLGDDM